MGQSNAETVRALYEAFGKGDVAAVMVGLPDDIHFRIGGRNPVAGAYHGKNEVLGFFGSLLERSGGTFRLEVRGILANDDGAVVLTRETAHVDDRVLDNRAVHVWTMPGGVCQSFQAYNEENWDDFWS